MCQCSSLITNIIPLCLFEPSVLFDLRNLRNAPHGAQQNFNKEPNKAKQLCYVLHQAPAISLIPQPWIHHQQRHSTAKWKGMLHIWGIGIENIDSFEQVTIPVIRSRWTTFHLPQVPVTFRRYPRCRVSVYQGYQERPAPRISSCSHRNLKTWFKWKNNWTAQRVSSTSRIRQTLEYTFWGYVYPPCPFTSHARGGFFGYIESRIPTTFLGCLTQIYH